MKIKLHFSFIVMLFLAGVQQAAAQFPTGPTNAFFRISGPAATTISAFNPDGTIVWSNAQPGATYTVQASSSLSGDWVDYVQIPVTNAVNTNLIIDFNPPAGMALIPAGSFTMGDTLDVEYDAIPTNVTVSAFYMDVNLVSYSQWQSVYNWATNQGYQFDRRGSGKEPDHPVQTVNWYDAVKWCNARSQQAGLMPVYDTDAGLTQLYTNGHVAPFVNWAANGYRLPTEAEWEKAARGGLSGKRFPWGDTISETQNNYYGDTLHFTYDFGPTGFNTNYAVGDWPFTSPVGSFEPNGYGLYDMAGNMIQWCWDWSDGSYTGGIDPRGPASSPTGSRVLRGGDWSDSAWQARCAFRDNLIPTAADYIFGFRSARGL